ncbi:hypothetical protein Dimus_006615 [Dionaea muscipula]
MVAKHGPASCMTLPPSAVVHGHPCMDARMMVVGCMGASCPQGAGHTSTARTYGLLLALYCSRKVAGRMAWRGWQQGRLLVVAAHVPGDACAGRAWPAGRALCWPRWSYAPLAAHGGRAAVCLGLLAAVVAMHPPVFARVFGGYALACMAKPAWTCSDGHKRVWLSISVSTRAAGAADLVLLSSVVGNGKGSRCWWRAAGVGGLVSWSPGGARRREEMVIGDDVLGWASKKRTGERVMKVVVVWFLGDELWVIGNDGQRRW